MNNIKVVLITGGFDPLHSGHISYIKTASSMGDLLIVGANSDNWLTRKKGKAFLPFEEREIILQNIKGVDFVISFNDDDETANDAIRKTREMFPKAHIVFANGGDRNAAKNVPEFDYPDTNLSFSFGVGGQDKKNSSSWILKNWETK